MCHEAKNNEMDNLIAIDSLKIRLPLEEVTVINPDLNRTFNEVSDLGELSSSEWKKKALTIKTKGITTRYAIQKSNAVRSEMRHFLVILFNSKLLGENYLSGIHGGTWLDVYDQIIKQNIVMFSPNTFLDGFITDVDIKRDVIASNDQIKATIENLKVRTKPSKQKSAGYSSRITENIMILQYSKRDVATITYPHVKIYAKTLELLFNSNDFAYNFHLENIGNIMRTEATIKNKDHFNTLIKPTQVESFSLKAILSLSQTKLEHMLKEMVQKHIYTDTLKMPDNSGNLTLSEMLCICLLKATGSLDQCFFLVDHNGKDKDQRYNARKYLKNAYDKLLKPSEKAQISHNDELIKWFIE
jgi:hypothetical protein